MEPSLIKPLQVCGKAMCPEAAKEIRGGSEGGDGGRNCRIAEEAQAANPTGSVITFLRLQTNYISDTRCPHSFDYSCNRLAANPSVPRGHISGNTHMCQP